MKGVTTHADSGGYANYALVPFFQVSLQDLDQLIQASGRLLLILTFAASANI